MQVSSGAFVEFGFSHCLDVKSRQVQVITPLGTELSSTKKTPGRMCSASPRGESTREVNHPAPMAGISLSSVSAHGIITFCSRTINPNSPRPMTESRNSEVNIRGVFNS